MAGVQNTHACMHAMACSQKWEQLAFPTILQYHVPDYYWFERLQQIYDNNIFPVIQDQIQYNGITHPPNVWKKQAGCPRKKWFRKQSEFLDPGDSPISCSLCGKSGHNQTTCPKANMAPEAEQP